MLRTNICDEKNIHILGRSYAEDNILTLFWTGSGIEFEISASELWVEFVADYTVMEHWISIEINGSFVARQMLTKGSHNICIFRNMNHDVVKHVRIMREVQAMSDDNNCCLQIKNISHDGTILPIKERKRKIEFVGDSITSGQGLYGARCEEDWNSMFFGTVQNYAVRTADALNADFDIISQSGWGVYLSWEKDPEKTLPPYYEKICGVVHGEINTKLHAHEFYDFGKNRSDVVVVNLGTNDDAALRCEEGYSTDGIYNFKEAVKGFLKKIRKYNADAYIIWAYGMLGTGLLKYINEAVEDYISQSGDEKVSVLVLPEMNETTVGACGHPGKKNHLEAATVLTEYIRDKLGWRL